MTRNHWRRIQPVAALLGMVIAAINFYPLRELVVALIIFSVLFGIVGMAFLTFFLLQELARQVAIHVETHLAGVRARQAGVSSQQRNDRVLSSPQ